MSGMMEGMAQSIILDSLSFTNLGDKPVYS